MADLIQSSTPAQPNADFMDKLGRCINSMSQDDAVGDVIVFTREGSELVPKPVWPEDVDLDNILQYEMILFDGGNTAGDCWKHTFLPRSSQHFFVDESSQPRVAPAAEPRLVQFSIDGGKSYLNAPNGVIVQYPNLPIGGESEPGLLQVSVMPEWVLMDLYATREEPLDYSLGNSSETIDDIQCRLMGTNF